MLGVPGVVLTVVAVPFGLPAPLGGIALGAIIAALPGAAFASISYTAALLVVFGVWVGARTFRREDG